MDDLPVTTCTVYIDSGVEISVPNDISAEERYEWIRSAVVDKFREMLDSKDYALYYEGFDDEYDDLLGNDDDTDEDWMDGALGDDPIPCSSPESPGCCMACRTPFILPGGMGGTGLCGPCCTGEADTLGEIGSTW